jgi:hypothetical protein
MRPTVLSTAVMLLASALTTGCSTLASSTPVAYRELPASSDLRPAKGDNAFEFRDLGDLRGYTSLLLEPVAVYGGRDAQFGSVAAADRLAIATYMTRHFAESLGERYRVVTRPEAGTLRVKLTLTGIETTKPLLSAMGHLSPAGAVINAGLQVAGKNGTGFGTVTYAADITDASSGARVYAFVTKQTPDALDLTAGLGTLEAARIGVRIGAKSLREDLQKHGMTPASTQQSSIR